jgi:hypothetical protein
MSVCKSLKGYARQHERVADIFSLFAVVLFFGSLYLGGNYYSAVIQWIKQDFLLHSLIILGLLLLDLFLIFLCLNIGSARFTTEDESCFQTFKGRRSGSGSIGMMLNGWLHHIEHVGKKHR